MLKKIQAIYTRLSKSKRNSKVGANLAIWIALVIAQMVHAIKLESSNESLKNLIFKGFIVDYQLPFGLFLAGVTVYFISTVLNKKNTPDKDQNQNLIEGELTSTAMNVGGALFLYSSTIFLTVANSTMQIILPIGAALAIYIIAWFFLPD